MKIIIKFVFLTLLVSGQVYGFPRSSGPHYTPRSNNGVTRDTIEIPEIVIEQEVDVDENWELIPDVAEY